VTVTTIPELIEYSQLQLHLINSGIVVTVTDFLDGFDPTPYNPGL
jgi:hypothetical protein